jgi:HNH endonuclease/NUMOD4 motif
MKEIWRDIPGFVGWYKISSIGRVRRIKAHPRGMFITGRILKRSLSGGYARCGLSKNGKNTQFKVHQLVAMAFIGPRPKGKEINHKDGDTLNNVPDNLEWVTHRKNIIHKYHVLGHKMIDGERHHMARASTQEVKKARRMIASGMDKREVAAAFGHHFSWAYRLANGQTRVHG